MPFITPMFPSCSFAARMAAVVVLAVAPVAAVATTPEAPVGWHADLDAALAAARQSRRPVLAIFTASWAPAGSAPERAAVSSPEAAALVSACFEPVCLDIDTHAEDTRRFGVTRVPTACVLTPDERLVASFELPDQPARFVAEAARAVQAAAAAASGPGAELAATAAPAAARPPQRSPTVSAFGCDTDLLAPRHAATTPEAASATAAPAAAVAAKVRQLSAFAAADSPAHDPAQVGTMAQAEPLPQAVPVRPAEPVPAPAPIPPRYEPETSSWAATPTPAAAGATATPEPPAAVAAATTTPATTIAGFAGSPTGPLSIEPAPQLPANPTASAPWLGGSAAPADAPARNAAAPATAIAAAQPGGNGQVAAPIEPKPAPAASASAAPGAPTAPTDKPASSASASFIAALQKPLSLFSRPTKSAAKATATTAATAAAPATAADSTAASDPYGSMPLGLEGYCPVTLTERGAWIEGRAQFGARHRGRTYLFAGPEQQQAFLADPDRYAPALSGDDPVLAFDAGRSSPGQRRYGVTYQARMYLFSSPETRDTFAANPQRYTTGTLVAENRSGSVIR